jgi:hypothetical protein
VSYIIVDPVSEPQPPPRLRSEQLKQLGLDLGVLSVPSRLAILDLLGIQVQASTSEIGRAIKHLRLGLRQHLMCLEARNMIVITLAGGHTVWKLTDKGYSAVLLARALLDMESPHAG